MAISDLIPEDNPTFRMMLPMEGAWMIRNIIRPGIDIAYRDPAVNEIDRITRALRIRVNNLILRMMDEEEDALEIELDSQEAWALDSIIPFDGPGGVGTGMIVSILRGLWYLDIGRHIAGTSDLVADPRADWSNTKLKGLAKGSEGVPATPQMHGFPDDFAPSTEDMV
ncbi:hypothetical protein LCGC14_0410250 [marine sediment metagenome]|uniref:Uncharacterized protein n=1 Tax=marine sediment metagenome TaxID=412755 RepID=A0A0F9VG68_9ZZZZ